MVNNSLSPETHGSEDARAADTRRQLRGNVEDDERDEREELHGVGGRGHRRFLVGGQ